MAQMKLLILCYSDENEDGMAADDEGEEMEKSRIKIKVQ